MRHFLLLPPALLVLLSATPAAAATSELCARVQYQMPPVSTHYVSRVLARANDGLAYAREGAVDNAFDAVLPGWANTVRSAWANLMDAHMQRTFEQSELPHITACLQADLLLIDCKMEEVRQELRSQLSRGSSIAIRQLTELLQFLNERRRNVEIGSLDPLYSDPDWNTQYGFDREPPAKVQMCPFDADYAPAFQNGFGCDPETMEQLVLYPPAAAEKEALEIIMNQVQKVQSGAIALLSVQKELDELFGNQSTTPDPPEERTHLNAFGCGWTAGYCKGDSAFRCTTDTDCEATEIDGDTCEFPKRVCEGNRVVRCNEDSHCGEYGPCMNEDENPQLPPLRELRGSFSLSKDQLAILSEFIGVRGAQEIARAFPDDLKVEGEFSDQEKNDDRAFEDRNPFARSWRMGQRLAVQLWSRLQARKEALIFPEAVDAPLEIAASLDQLHTAVSSLAKLASKKDEGLRAFTASYASFLARTCIYRPCQMLLEQVIRLVTTDACFPYANGEYLDDDEENPRWEKCREAAGI